MNTKTQHRSDFRLGLLAAAVIAATAGGASAAATSRLEGRLDTVGLSALSDVQHTTRVSQPNSYEDGYPLNFDYPGPETVWASGNHWAHTLMARPAPSTLTSRTERSQAQTWGWASASAITRVAMQPNEVETFTLTLTDMVTDNFAYQPYLPTSIISTLTVRFFHTAGQFWYDDGAVSISLFSNRVGDLLVHNVGVQSSFAWDTSAIAAALQLSLADGSLDAPISFPAFSFTAPSTADSVWYELRTVGHMSPTPGTFGLAMVGGCIALRRQRPRTHV